MFSGIVEGTARVIRIDKDRENVHFTLTCPFADELRVDQSLAHNGVCLTVVAVGCKGVNPSQSPLGKNEYVVTAMRETLDRTNFGLLKPGDEVNLERSMMMNGRLDGHIVQGHVDQTATCVSREDENGSYRFTFRYATSPEMVRRGYFCVDKGSVTVNGVSLTVCNPTADTFQVCIIPYTFDVTNFHHIVEGVVVNLEFDIIGKYISRYSEILSQTV